MLDSFPARCHRTSFEIKFQRTGTIRRPITGLLFCPEVLSVPALSLREECPTPPPPTTFGGWTGTRKHPVDVSKFYLFVVRVVLQHFRAIKIVQWPGHFAWPIEKLGHSLFGRIF